MKTRHSTFVNQLTLFTSARQVSRNRDFGVDPIFAQLQFDQLNLSSKTVVPNHCSAQNTSVLQAVPKCSTEETNLTYFNVLFKLFGL